MTHSLSTAEGRAYRRRWAVAADFELQELRARTIQEKFEDLCQLWHWVEDFGWQEQLADEQRADELRRRWNAIRRKYLGEI
jgi:hypothetical protein